ncbi:MAG: four helix bundle protein, partial [Verrucomicrobia bacterium]|nr:four helix bundle protein [Verrucomicrobiota bacterium]
GNIAEAFKKRSRADKPRILNISQGSLSESQYCLILSRDLQYARTGSLRINLDDVAKLLERYMQAMDRTPQSTHHQPPLARATWGYYTKRSASTARAK